MPEPVRRIRDRELHEMTLAAGVWSCSARNPRCAFATGSWAEAMGHVTGHQPDRREEPPIPDIVGTVEERVA